MHDDFFSSLMAAKNRPESGTAAAMSAGLRADYYKCRTNKELAAWFAAIAVHCRHIINGTKP